MTVEHSLLTSIHPGAHVDAASPSANANDLWVQRTGSAPYKFFLRNAANSAWEAVSIDTAGELAVGDLAVAGLTGATSASRYAGATASGAPTSGTFAVGDYIVDRTGKIYICTTAGSPGTWTQVGTGGSALPYALIREEQTSGTAGGTFTSGAWRTRVLNTKATDIGGNVTLASNQITLVAGTYQILAFAPVFVVAQHQARLFNVTDSALVLTGTSNYADAGGLAANHALVAGRFTIAASKALELQHQCATTRATNGFGVTGGFGTEVYSTLMLWRES